MIRETETMNEIQATQADRRERIEGALRRFEASARKPQRRRHRGKPKTDREEA